MEKIFSQTCVIPRIPRYYGKLKFVHKRTAVNLAYKTYGHCGSARVTPLIVLHGLLGSKKNWESMSKKLASGLDTCAVAADARNHGESPHDSSHSYFDLASDVLKLIDTLGLKRATLIGHSMGGRTAMVVALTQPNKIDRLVVVDISPISTAGILNNFFPRLIDVMKSVSFNGIKNVNDARTVAKNKIIASGVLSNMDGMNFLLMNIAKRKDNTIGWVYNLDTLKDSFNLIASFPREIRNKKFFGHTLFVGGESSNYIPPNDLDGIRSLFPNSKLKYVPRVGHNVHTEDPHTFFQLVKQFLSNK